MLLLGRFTLPSPDIPINLNVCSFVWKINFATDWFSRSNIFRWKIIGKHLFTCHSRLSRSCRPSVYEKKIGCRRVTWFITRCHTMTLISDFWTFFVVIRTWHVNKIQRIRFCHLGVVKILFNIYLKFATSVSN